MPNRYEEKTDRKQLYYEEKDNILTFVVTSNYSRNKEENVKFTTKSVQRFLVSKGYNLNDLKNPVKEDFVCNFMDVKKDLTGEWRFELPVKEPTLHNIVELPVKEPTLQNIDIVWQKTDIEEKYSTSVQKKTKRKGSKHKK